MFTHSAAASAQDDTLMHSALSRPPINVVGWPLVKPLLNQKAYTIKSIANENAIAFFTTAAQHAEVKVFGLSYEDNYRGNALALVITKGRAEIRYHKAFSDERVRCIIGQLQREPELQRLVKEHDWYYQGRLVQAQNS